MTKEKNLSVIKINQIFIIYPERSHLGVCLCKMNSSFLNLHICYTKLRDPLGAIFSILWHQGRGKKTFFFPLTMSEFFQEMLSNTLMDNLPVWSLLNGSNYHFAMHRFSVFCFDDQWPHSHCWQLWCVGKSSHVWLHWHMFRVWREMVVINSRLSITS